jgi:hypothetical protein
MPPKKDDKKKKGEALSVKEVDPALYVRKVSFPDCRSIFFCMMILFFFPVV